MPTEFNVLVDDLSVAGRWYLGSPATFAGEAIDPRRFLDGRRYASGGGVRVGLRQPGRPLDFTLADFDMPVVSEELANRLMEVAPSDVQLVPAEVEGTSERFFVMNVLSVVRCLDEERSGVTLWPETDGRLDRVGQYRMVLEPHVRPEAVDGERIFRIAGWEVSLVIGPLLEPLIRKASGARLDPA